MMLSECIDTSVNVKDIKKLCDSFEKTLNKAIKDIDTDPEIKSKQEVKDNLQWVIQEFQELFDLEEVI